MTEKPSDTSDDQRFDEMYIHLTPRGATVPYNVTFDPEGNLWVATKGGLFKFDGTRRTTLWERKNLFPKKMAAFPQVVSYKDQIIYTCGEANEKMTEFRIFSLDGTMKHESFIDGLLVSLTVSDEGEIFITKQPTGVEKSAIYRASVDAPIGWDEVVTVELGEGFFALCSLNEETLVAAVSQTPMNPYSKQRLVFVNVLENTVTKSFTSEGKTDGLIFFPRTIRRYEEGFLLVDKAGRFLKYDMEGNFVGKLAEIDAYLANGFCVKDKEALMALSGIVLDSDKRTICDDWLEFIKLNGTTWAQQREEAKVRNGVEEMQISSEN